MHNMWSYIGKELRLLPQKDIPVNYQIIDRQSERGGDERVSFHLEFFSREGISRVY